jgi:hypothetical protein
MKKKYKIIALITSLITLSTSMLAQGVTLGAGVNFGQVNAQTGTSYTVVALDQGKLVSLTNASPVTVTLPQATGQFGNGWTTLICNYGAGLVTIAPNTGTINGGANITESQNNCNWVFSDGTNYKASIQSGGGSPGAPSTSPQYNNAGSFAGIPNTVVLVSGSNQIPSTPVAGTTYVLNDTSAPYIQTAAVTVSADSVSFVCSVGVVIKFSGATGGFNVSGNNAYFSPRCTFDHNSQSAAGTGPLMKVTAGIGGYFSGKFQNAGTTNPQTATVLISGGSIITLEHLDMRAIADYAVGIIPAASTTIKDISFTHSNIACDHTVGNPNWGCVFANDTFNSGSAIQGGLVEDVTVHDNGPNSNAFWWAFNLAGAQGQGSSTYGWRIAHNNCVLDGRINTCFQMFGFYKLIFEGNHCNDVGNIITHCYHLGDSYDLTDQGNIATITNAFATACHEVIDYGRIVVSGNICNGGGGANNPVFVFNTVGGEGSYVTITANIANMVPQSATGTTCFKITGAYVTQPTSNEILTSNTCVGSGASGQTGVSITNTTGTVAKFRIADNQFVNLATGISVGASVTGVEVGPNLFDTVTTKWSFASSTLLQDNSGVTFANIPSNLANGSTIFVSDSTIANPCASGGSGAILKRLNGINVCN